MHEQQIAQAQILIVAGPEGLGVEVQHIDDTDNPAVIFARYVGENSQRLFSEAIQHRNRQSREAEKATREIIRGAAPRLLDASGHILTKD